MGWQAGDTLGIFLGFSANLIAARVIPNWKSSWRWQTASISLPAFCLMCLIWTIPDSPRLHLKKGQYRKAYEAMCLLRRTPLQAARDLFYANAQLQVESDNLLDHIDLPVPDTEDKQDLQLERYQLRVRRLRWWQRFRDVFAKARVRRALQASLIVMVGQQFCGL